MATTITPIKPLNESQLAKFLPDQESIRRFQLLFSSAQTLIDQLQGVADTVEVLLVAPPIDLGTAASRNTSTNGDAKDNEVVLGKDSRLSNGRPPSGSAGGALAGTYPNPIIAPNVVPFTATLGGSGSSLPTGRPAYLVRIGNLRAFFIDYDLPLSAGAGSGALQLFITGLPEAAAQTCSGAVGLRLNAPVDKWKMAAGSADIYLFSDTGTGFNAATGADILGDFQIGISGYYFV